MKSITKKPDFQASGVYDIATVTGIGDYSESPDHTRYIYKKSDQYKAFLIINKHTIELRTDNELRKLLKDKYESVMDSRYFGNNGIEIVLAGDQLAKTELDDLVRLSYNLTA